MLRVETSAALHDGYIIIKSQQVFLDDQLICDLPTGIRRMWDVFDGWRELKKLGYQHFKDNLNSLISEEVQRKLMTDDALSQFLKELNESY